MRLFLVSRGIYTGNMTRHRRSHAFQPPPLRSAGGDEVIGQPSPHLLSPLAGAKTCSRLNVHALPGRFTLTGHPVPRIDSHL